MASNRTLLIQARERLQELGGQVAGGAESFHRERVALLAEVAGDLSWRGMLGLGQGATRLVPRVDELTTRGHALRALFDRIGQIEDSLKAAARTLDQIKDDTLRAPDGIPATAERLRVELRRLGRQVRTDDDLMVDQRRCADIETAATRWNDALTLWLSAEEALAKVRGTTRTAALEAALPELSERLCREGPTPPWRAELKRLLDPLEQLVRREQPREIKETEKIIKDLPRWARVLGEDGDACAALTTRFMAKRKDWPGEDDRTFQDLFDQARRLEQSMLDKAAAVRGNGITALEDGYAQFVELIGPDPRFAEQLRDLSAEAPDGPRDFEDWLDQLRDTNTAFQARVKRSESELLAKLDLYLAECRRRLDTLDLIPRLDSQDEQLGRLRASLEPLSRAGEGVDALVLLADVQRIRDLRTALEALERAIRKDHDEMEAERVAVQRRVRWLTERAGCLGIELPAMMPLGTPGAGRLQDSGSEPTSLDQEWSQLKDEADRLSDAEAHFTQVCVEEIDAADQRTGRVLAVLAPDRIPDDAPDLSPIAPESGSLGDIASRLEGARARLARLDALLPDEEQARVARLLELQQSLTAIPAERLGQHDRGEREQLLRQLERRDLAHLTDPVDRIEALIALGEGAEHLFKRIEGAARRLAERRAGLSERLRRFNSLSLQGYCPDTYLRVEALVHPPPQTHWPRGSQEGQLREAERLLGLLERQAQRLAAREIAGHVQVLQQHARRTADGEAQAVVDEVLALTPEQPPPARLRRRLAELAEAHAARV